MRPIRLEFQAFGSYPGVQTVDFEALANRGLFVVTGPTGTGKTTIFDAMVYALYGVLPGQRSSDGDPRSHHAAAETETEVTLEFEVEGDRYRVRRQPQWERPKKRGEGTTPQAAKAILTKLVGGVTEPLATQASACTRMCEGLIGLDAKQFQRVVLLPQGKFTEFLISTDDDREKLLRQLFGGELYEQAVVWLKDQMKRLDSEVGDVDIQLQHHRSNAVSSLTTVEAAWLGAPRGAALEALDDVGLREAVEALQPIRADRLSAVAASKASATVATERKTAAEALATRYDAAERTRLQLTAFEVQRDDVEAGARRAEASRLARPVVKAGEETETASAAARLARAQLAETASAVTNGFHAMSMPVPTLNAAAVATAVQQADQQAEAERQLLTAAREAALRAQRTEAETAVATAAHAVLVTLVATVQGDIEALKTKIASLEPIAGKQADHRAARDAAQQRLDTRTKLAVAVADLAESENADAAARLSYERVMARFVATQAPRLAAALVVDEPCPVCGSTAHPAPARLDEGDEVDHTAVDSAREVWAKAREVNASHRAAVADCRSALGSQSDEPVDHYRLALADAEQVLSTARAAADGLRDARTAADACTRELASAVAREHTSGRSLAALEERARVERADAEAKATAAADLDEAALAARLTVLASLKTAAASLPTLIDAVTSGVTRRESAARALADELLTSGYASVDAAHQALVASEAEDQSVRRASEWNTAVQEQATRLKQLVEQGVPDTRPDVELLAQSEAEAHANAAEAARTFTTASNALDAADEALQQVLEISTGSVELRRRRDTARTVFKTCNGEAGIKVKLERWVLAGKLDRVTQAANVHLARMTSSRYQLGRAKGSRGGLTLEVFDAHTGRARTTASLSGGEQFQASLALALGLADVVSHGGTASGKLFEALFVDEGFGSLDPDALDDAISALSMLQAAGRVVGAITHVEAMKERLHVGIEVRRLADGKGSTLLVNP